MKNIKAFIDLIDDNMCPINEEIKDDKEALEIWGKMSKLQNTLEDFLEEEEKRQDQERIAEQKKNIQRVDAQVKGVKW
jgi:predicted RNA-binding protein